MDNPSFALRSAQHLQLIVTLRTKVAALNALEQLSVGRLQEAWNTCTRVAQWRAHLLEQSEVLLKGRAPHVTIADPWIQEALRLISTSMTMFHKEASSSSKQQDSFLWSRETLDHLSDWFGSAIMSVFFVLRLRRRAAQAVLDKLNPGPGGAKQPQQATDGGTRDGRTLGRYASYRTMQSVIYEEDSSEEGDDGPPHRAGSEAPA